MKRCPRCNLAHDDALSFCRADGTRLITGSIASESTATALLPAVAPSGEVSTQLPHQAPSIAVLPFANMSSDAENEYFCDGLAEDILNALAKVEGLKVAARTSAFSFKGRETNVGEVGRTLNVNSVLEGGVRKSGDRVRVTVQLISAADGYHLWSERYDRRLEDIFDVQDEITLAVVDALKVRLLGDKKAAVLKRHTGNSEAHQLYLKGRYFWYRGAPEDFVRSRDYFLRAVELDPAYALAYAGLADAYGFPAATGLARPDEGWPKAEAAALKARELDDGIAEVYNPLAAQRFIYHRDWAGAEREFSRAFELNANFAEIHNLRSVYLVVVGRLEEAIAEGRRSLELDPLSVISSKFLGDWLYYARRYDEAVGQYRAALELAPDNAWVHEALGDVLEQQGVYEGAVAEWRSAMMLAGDEELAVILSRAHSESGFTAAARAVARERLKRLDEVSQGGGYAPAVGFARAYLRLGDKEQAFRWLERACEERNLFPLLINSDPFYDGLRSDPCFAALVRKVGLPQ
ncbi:MAG TPA: tetratricopeptide repeat protein [Pyrinomonadaceae bacterium]|nr:tetratricopeptide repeat protein [Pyrinomonadaceae bacterium]